MENVTAAGPLKEGMNAGKDCVLISVTPTRNESWIVRPFVAAARLWADRVIVIDQCSTDSTREFLREMPGVELILNDSPVFDEAFRQRTLLDRARQSVGKRILLGLDADEALSPNCLTSSEWKKICEAAPGTVLSFKWVNILPGFKEAWIPPNPLTCGFVDDGSEHNPKRIHSPRVPRPPGAPTLALQEIVVLHFQYVVWERMLSKQRWYQAWEHIKHQQKGPLEIFRQYNHMLGGWPPGEIFPVKPEWLEGFDRAGIDFRQLAPEAQTWWDREIVQMLLEHGTQKFRRIALWDHDWNASARKAGFQEVDLSDPRSAWEKWVHRFLSKTQKRRSTWFVRITESFLRRTGW